MMRLTSVLARAAAFMFVACLSYAGAADAQNTLLWTNSAGSNAITAVDKNTGVLDRQFNPGKGNGRGMVVVGNTIYFTIANNGNVYKLDATTGADLGIAFTVPGASGLSTIAFDGTNFWIGDYSGTNNAYYVTPTGTVLKTVSLANCTSFCDGLEFFNGKLISNRGDSPVAVYDVYDTNGVLLQAAFISGSHQGRGIAFDGTNFFIADASTIYVYDGTTGAFIRQMTPGGTGQNYEDLSTDYAQRIDTGGGGGGGTAPAIVNVPTLSEWSLIALLSLLGLGGAAALRRRQ